VYDHCLRAIEKAGALGPHALPLIGSGDWNDGMNLVGSRGRGESIWLGWFLYATLNAFAPICELMGQADRAEEMRSRAVSLAAAIERSGWDGGWYRRGYYDDGGPLGSAPRDECRIDALAQSWAVLSGAADPAARIAMQAPREQLVRQRERLILLLAPPFDHSAQEPGYIKGYPPGVRENGGQYSHAAVWAIWAIAQLGDADGAAQLFSNLLPFNHASDGNAARRYAIEPYVLAGDVYAGAHVGRGGWSWYTGAAGWAYRFGWEMLLGVRQEREGWRIEPSLPSHWTRCTVTIRHAATTYEIDIAQRPRGKAAGTRSYGWKLSSMD
jgi:cyclic beta-1,2-glucan synthetase